MTYRRCPLGSTDCELRVRLLPSHRLELRVYARRPDDADFHPSDDCIVLPVAYAEHLADLLGMLAGEAETRPVDQTPWAV